MIQLNIIVEGSSEENFVNSVLKNHFTPLHIFIASRKIKTGWDGIHNKPAKGGLLKYIKFRNDVLRWIESDRNRESTFYTSFIDLYAFPIDDQSPYSQTIQDITDPYRKIKVLEEAIAHDVNHASFIPYIQLHEFEAFILVDPDKLLYLYPDKQGKIGRLKREIHNKNPEEINESPHTAPSKRIIKHIPEYEFQKSQVGPLVAEDIGMEALRSKCPHFNEWITKLEALKVS